MNGDPLEFVNGLWTTSCPHEDCDWVKEHSNRAWLRGRLDGHLKTHKKKEDPTS